MCPSRYTRNVFVALLMTTLVSLVMGQTSQSDSFTCYPDLPDPELAYVGWEDYTTPMGEYTRYWLSVANWEEFPDALFEQAPDLPPCGSNPEWVGSQYNDFFSATVDGHEIALDELGRRFSFKVRMNRSAHPFPCGSRTKDGEAVIPRKVTSSWKSSAMYCDTRGSGTGPMFIDGRTRNLAYPTDTLQAIGSTDGDREGTQPSDRQSASRVITPFF